MVFSTISTQQNDDIKLTEKKQCQNIKRQDKIQLQISNYPPSHELILILVNQKHVRFVKVLDAKKFKNVNEKQNVEKI